MSSKISIKEVKHGVVATLQKCCRAPEFERGIDLKAKISKISKSQPQRVRDLLKHV